MTINARLSIVGVALRTGLNWIVAADFALLNDSRPVHWDFIRPPFAWSSVSVAATSALEITVVESENRVVVRLKGDAGVSNADELDRRLIPLSAKRPALVVFDLSDLVFISSLGLGILMQFQRGINRHGGTVRFAGAQAPVADMLKKCRLDSVFILCDTVTAALDSQATSAENARRHRD